MLNISETIIYSKHLFIMWLACDEEARRRGVIIRVFQTAKRVNMLTGITLSSVYNKQADNQYIHEFIDFS